MSLRFKANAMNAAMSKILNELNDFMQNVGCQDTYTIDADKMPTITLTLDQTVPFVPDRDTIQKYINIMAEKLKNDKEIIVTNIQFDGYDYIYAIESPSNTKETTNELEDNN